ncbi:universal stress protein (plasmid) [Halorubrum sp. BOL3-1]|uniref:universal stress protein n=1 Tax=Halorubrum sp. BOL3-1 TaxID=2497325 RepID=UPI001004F6C4|nr:universal stress protein [Halorubrum sp. BOL3-1]QAU14503.1 universal stress protein [Halorubrum sp. BOL3-1]
MYDTILIPTDGSDGARKAIREGIQLADLTGATVHGLYVIDTRDYNTLPESKWLSLQDELESTGETATEVVESEADARDVDTVTSITRGIPHEEILAYIESNDIDVVVMGTHGRSGFNRFLLGSVTEKVIRQSPVPVHIVRINDDE